MTRKSTEIPFTAEELHGGAVPDEILQVAFGIPEKPKDMIEHPSNYCMRCRTILPTDASRPCPPFAKAGAVCRNSNGDRTRIFCPPKIDPVR